MEKNPLRINNEWLVNEHVDQDYRYLRNKNVEKELDNKEKFQKYEKQKFFEQYMTKQRYVSEAERQAGLVDYDDEAQRRKRFASLKKSNAQDPTS